MVFRSIVLRGILLSALLAAAVPGAGCTGGRPYLRTRSGVAEKALKAPATVERAPEPAVLFKPPAASMASGAAQTEPGHPGKPAAGPPGPAGPSGAQGGRPSAVAIETGSTEAGAGRRALPAAAEAQAGKTLAADPQEGGEVDFNFDDADLYEVIRVIAELLNLNYIVDANIQGKVTIHTSRKIRKSDLFPIFSQILETNGLAAVKEGALYRIVPFKDASRLPITARLGELRGEVPPGEKIVLEIIPLRYVSAAEMSKLLTPFVSAGGTIISHGESNTLLIVDKWMNVLKALRLVEAFDADLFERYGHRFYPLEHFDAEEMVKILGEVFLPYASGAKQDPKFVAISRLNTVLAISTNPRVFERAEAFIRQMDVPSQEAEPQIYVYFVKNGKADQLSTLLKAIFKDRGKSKEAAKSAAPREFANPLSRESVQQKQAQEKQAKPEGQPNPAETGGASAPEAPGSLRSEVNITADEVRNALIIEATPRDYRIVEKILGRLDVLPRQVLIEVIVAEITLDDRTELGIEWTYTKGAEVGSGLLSASVGESGLNFAVGLADRVKGIISALASENKVNILSSPTVLASDNKEAKIDVSTEVPVASSQFRYTTGEEPLTETSIQYRDTGVLLTVTPHINERGLVTMDINQEVSEQTETNVKVGGQDYPSFFKRSVNTSLTVGHGQTIVIGGLIKETRSGGASGLPWLINVPVIRYLFGKEKQTLSKTELIILITPRVISSLEEVDSVTEEFKSKVGRVTERL